MDSKVISCALSLVVIISLLSKVALVYAETSELMFTEISISDLNKNYIWLTLKIKTLDNAENLSLFLVFQDPHENYTLWVPFERIHQDGTTTIFMIDGPIPVVWNNRDFPFDNYTCNIFIGTNYFFNNRTYRSGRVSSSLKNYEAKWIFSYFGGKSRILEETGLPKEIISDEFGESWCKLRIQIAHSEDFQKFVDILINTVPTILFFLLSVMGLIFCSIIYDCIRNQKRESRRIELVEKIIIPVCVSIAVFIPMFQLSIQPLKEPYSMIKQDSEFYCIFSASLIVLIVATITRLLVKSTNSSCKNREKQEKGKQRSTKKYSLPSRDIIVIALSLVAIGIFFALSLLAKIAGLSMSDTTAVFLSIFPFIVYLILSGKISELSGGGWKVKFREAYEKPVVFETGEVAYLSYTVTRKSFMEQLEDIKKKLHVTPFVVLSLTLGRRYDREVLQKYLEELTKFDYFKYVVFLDGRSKFVGFINARVLLDLVKSTRGHLVLEAIANGDLTNVRGSCRDYILSSRTNYEALETLEKTKRPELAVVTPDMKFLGFTSKEIITSRIIKSMMEKTSSS
ncbi:MAG: hypothetical protein ACTSV7_02495 [Candidatus Baldrarchaeia archaeon]